MSEARRRRDVEPCAHRDERMIAYLTTPTREHTTISWCPACGALGTQSYTHGSRTVWTLPERG